MGSYKLPGVAVLAVLCPWQVNICLVEHGVWDGEQKFNKRPQRKLT